MAFSLESLTFKNGDFIPKKHTCDGENTSPPLRWTEAPAATKSYALVCDDPDAPMMTWIHWVIYSIPGDITELVEGIPNKAVLDRGIAQGINSSKRIGYGGPCPPGHSRHRYFFRLYALDTDLDLPPGATRHDLDKAMKAHILGQAELMGIYR